MEGKRKNKAKPPRSKVRDQAQSGVKDGQLLRADLMASHQTASDGLGAGRGRTPGGKRSTSKFVRENILQADFQTVEQSLELMKGETVLTVFDAKEGLIGQACFPSKLRVGKIATALPQEFGELTVKLPFHVRHNDKKCITYA